MKIESGKYEKILLAYSGGLDTTVAIPWLMDKTGADIYACGVDVGQPEDLEASKAKALAAGAVHAEFIDAKLEFVEECVLPSLKANALYEGVYPLLSALSRPVIVEKLVAKAKDLGVCAIAHGCTGKGNDQVRFEMSLAALAPDLDVLAPARFWGFTRDEAIGYAASHGIELPKTKDTPYSIDENLWGKAVECGILDDAWTEPPGDAYTLTTHPEDAADAPTWMTVEFNGGTPVALDGEPMALTDLITEVGLKAGACGVGRIDHIESRTVGIKSREVYECPAAIPLITAHQALEAMVLTRDELFFKHQVDGTWARLAYDGKWHTPLKTALDAFITATQGTVTGSVKLKMYKGSLAVVGRKSPCSLYDEGLATYGEGDPFDHAASEGFVKILAMETATVARNNQKKKAAVLTEVTSHEEVCLAQPVA